MLNSRIWLVIVIVLISFSSCGTINRFTRLKKTPREYSLNYCGEEIKAPKTDLNKQPWIVFSDRDNNFTLQNPGGKVKFKPAGFLDAFFVIGEKGDYLKLVKYDPQIVENNPLASRIKDRKKAQYYGWMHRSRLLLTRQSVTDIGTGYKNKQICIITDTTTLETPGRFFDTDSIKIFKDPDLSSPHGKIPVYGIVYTLKISGDGQKNLLARKTAITPDSAEYNVLGWVHGALIRDVGQRLHVNIDPLVQDSFLQFKDHLQIDTLSVSNWIFDESRQTGQYNPSLKYNPVMNYRDKNSTVQYKTGLAVPVIDRSFNYVFNVNGNKIMYEQFKILEKELKKLNLLFIFEGKEQVIEKYPEIINVIQNLQPLFEKEADSFSYRFGAVIASRGKMRKTEKDEWQEIAPKIESKGMLGSYTEVLDFLTSQIDTTGKARPTRFTWSGLRKGVEMIEPYKNETNIFVIVGEDGYSEWADSTLVRRMADANCRVLGYQLHSKEKDAGNNFVLQIENMIDIYGAKEAVTKREKIVYADQLKPENRYREVWKNVYALDFPDRSMTQGWILFPEKNVTLPMDILTNCIDSLISEVKWDNDNLTSSLYKAFNTVGNHRYQYDSLFLKYHRLDPALSLKKEFLKPFTKELPGWYLPANGITIPDTVNRKLNYYLLLSKEELEDLRDFIRALSAYEVDYKYSGEKERTKNRCNCPDDDLPEKREIRAGSETQPEYRSTRNIRKSLQDLYLSELKTCKLCKLKTGTIKRYTLAEAQRRITGCPSYSPVLQYKVGNIRRNRCLGDQELDTLITYFKQKKEALDYYLTNADSFESNGQIYYWIDQQLLP